MPDHFNADTRVGLRDGKLSFALVWLPELAAQEAFAAYSAALTKTYPRSTHQLVTGFDAPWRHGLTGTIADHGHLLTQAYSLPHIPLASFRATPEQAADVVASFTRVPVAQNVIGHYLPVETGDISFQQIRSDAVQRNLRDVRASDGYNVEVAVRRSKQLVDLRSMALSVLYGHSLTGILRIRSAWSPVMILARVPRQTQRLVPVVTQPPEVSLPPRCVAGEFALGLLGPDRQLRCSVMSFAEYDQVNGAPVLPGKPLMQRMLLLSKALTQA